LLSSGNGGVALDEWKAVPDIWRTSAENFGDKVALVDQYHDPPSTMTYKQVIFFFLFLFLFYLFQPNMVLICEKKD
jgi:long-chain acyl-CoA synthetase